MNLFADSNADDFFSNLSSSKGQVTQGINHNLQPKSSTLQRKAPQALIKNEGLYILASFEEAPKSLNDSQILDTNIMNSTHNELQRKDSTNSFQSSVSTRTEGDNRLKINRVAPLKKNLISVPKNLFD